MLANKSSINEVWPLLLFKVVDTVWDNHPVVEVL